MADSKLVYSFDVPVADVLKYSFLVVSVLGLVGNSFSLLTVTSKKCKKSSFTVYIAFLAVVDSCMLVTNSFDTLLLGAYKVDFGQNGKAIFKCIRFSQALFRLLSAWIIIAITAERALATIYPLRFKGIYSIKFSVKVVETMAGLMTLLNVYLLYEGVDYSYIDQSTRCDVNDRNFTFLAIYSVLAGILPLIIITMGNIVIIIKVRGARTRIAPSTSSTQSTSNTSRHLVVITLLISSAFVVCTAPFPVALSISPFAFDDTNDTQRQVVFGVALTLQNMNFALNFYLYILSGRRFRELFITAILCNRRGTPVQVTTGHIAKK